VPATLVAVRRVRDVSAPAAPVLLYINPLFADDAFPQRRRRLLAPQQARRLPSSPGSVSVDVQILQASTGAAASLTSQLAAAPLAAGVAHALQGSSLAGAQVAASVQPFPAAGGAALPAASQVQQGSGAAGAGAAGGVLLLFGVCAALYYRAVRRRGAVAPSAPVAAVNSTPTDATAAAAAVTGLLLERAGGEFLPLKGAPFAQAAPSGNDRRAANGAPGRGPPVAAAPAPDYESMDLSEVLKGYPSLAVQLCKDASTYVKAVPKTPYQVDLDDYRGDDVSMPSGAVLRLMELGVIVPQKKAK